MATSKARRSKAPSKPNSPVVATKADPQSWLYLNPAGPSPSGLVFAVLRKTYAGRVNRALEFGWRKCHVGHGAGAADVTVWSPNIERVETILPAGAEDSLSDPATLLARMDACAVAREKALLVYLTLPLGDVDRIHSGWERARSFVRERFARDRGLPVVLALHAPGRTGSSNPLHAHALILPRAAGGLGIAHGAYDQDLLHDAGQAIVETMWAEHMATFR